ncbi:MAG: hypothetical protein EXX96DRAFT_539859 [Benjaminiella poitrasii]|nr:MAG: hypothetical protein EXX96DRAFT_539859 [Benjaminiella poitrasii]
MYLESMSKIQDTDVWFTKQRQSMSRRVSIHSCLTGVEDETDRCPLIFSKPFSRQKKSAKISSSITGDMFNRLVLKIGQGNWRVLYRAFNFLLCFTVAPLCFLLNMAFFGN